jgi:hypothetical protein
MSIEGVKKNKTLFANPLLKVFYMRNLASEVWCKMDKCSLPSYDAQAIAMSRVKEVVFTEKSFSWVIRFKCIQDWE